MAGRTLSSRYNRGNAFYKYREDRGFDLDVIKEMLDEENEEIEAEWYGDGKWEVIDEQEDIEEENWERWYDLFP